jgi:hypothetical protein
MVYRVYSGPHGSERVQPLEKARLLFKEFGVLDEAMILAHHVNKSGRVALLIEGDDGTHLSASEIVVMLRHAEYETGKAVDVH